MSAEAEAVTDGVAVARALARSRIYRILALAFRCPEAGDAAALDQLAQTAGVEALGEGASGLAPVLQELASALQATDAEALRDRYVATFGHVTLPDCPLYETACGAGDPFRQPQTLADLSGFYRAFGLEVAANAGERGDHLAVELEFMHYLAYREAYALERHGAEQVAAIQDAERRFLLDHLGRWAPVVAGAVAARADGALGAAARLLERFLDDEANRWGISFSPVVMDEAPMIPTLNTDAYPAEGEGEPLGGEL